MRTLWSGTRCVPSSLFTDVAKIEQAAEAMGAISLGSSIPVLKQYLNDPNRSVRETCEIALAKIEWDNSPEGKAHNPAPTVEDRYVLCAHMWSTTLNYPLV